MMIGSHLSLRKFGRGLAQHYAIRQANGQGVVN